MKIIHPIIVAGQSRKTDKTLPVVSPYDGEEFGQTFLAGEGELEEAVEKSEVAFEELKQWSGLKKAEVIGRAVDGLERRSEELARVIALEAGKPIKSASAEVSRAINTFTVAMEEAKRPRGEVVPVETVGAAGAAGAPEGEKRTGIVRRFGVGPVLGISPFNFPLNLVAHKVAPAMAAGCPIIVKPASKTPFSALILGEIVRDACWPEGGISVLPCKSSLAEKVVRDDRIKKLTFTGSPEVGWKLKTLAGTKKVTLELGGNAGVVIDADSDIEFAAGRCVTGAFAYAGQVCISVQRIYVHKDIFDEFKKTFIEKTRALTLGDPLAVDTDIGPMIDQASLKRVEDWVAEAAKGGATIEVGGVRDGTIYEPTVLTNTKPTMKVSCDEVFGPVTILEPFSDFDTAIAELNNSRFGLQAGVFTKDMDRAFSAFEKLDVGGVIVNDIPTFRVDNMPYGGVKQSGFGREGVKYAIEEMTEPRLMVINHS